MSSRVLPFLAMMGIWLLVEVVAIPVGFVWLVLLDWWPLLGIMLGFFILPSLIMAAFTILALPFAAIGTLIFGSGD